MKNFKFICISLFVFISFISCSIQEIEFENAEMEISEQSINIQTLDFFLESSQNRSSDERSKSSYLHPLTVALHDTLLLLDTKNNFTNSFEVNYGCPSWYNATIYSSAGEKFAIVPTVKPDSKSISGLFIYSELKKFEGFNFVPLSDLVYNTTKSQHISNSLTKGLSFVAIEANINIYGEDHSSLSDYYCGSGDDIVSDPIISDDVIALDDCWKEITIFYDPHNNFFWQGTVLPPIYDHDMDGIVNWYDQDFRDDTRGKYYTS